MRYWITLQKETSYLSRELNMECSAEWTDSSPDQIWASVLLCTDPGLRDGSRKKSQGPENQVVRFYACLLRSR